MCCFLQDDEDLVLEFVYNQGLNALVSVGRDSDQTYQQYILKALGELAVYVDGMHGLIQCNEIIQWLYQLVSSKVRPMARRSNLLMMPMFVSTTYVHTASCIIHEIMTPDFISC